MGGEGITRVVGYYVLICAVDVIFYLSLAIWRFRIGHSSLRLLLLVAAFLIVALWAGTLLFGNPILVRLADAIKDFVWIGYIWAIIRIEVSRERTGWRAAYAALLIITLGRIAIIMTMPFIDMPLLIVVDSGLSFYNLAFCVVALVMLNNLYFSANSISSGFRIIIICLAISWSYDLNFYTAMVLKLSISDSVVYGRPTIVLILAPIFALAARRKERWAIGLSREATFQTLALIAIGAYFVFVAVAARFVGLASPGLMMDSRLIVIIIAIALVTIVVFSRRFRIWLKHAVTKTLFVHRYDYREEWLRFNATINGGRLSDLVPEQRAVKAVADVMGATRGQAFLSTASGKFCRVAHYNWPSEVESEEVEFALPDIKALTSQWMVIQFDRSTHNRIAVPDALLRLDGAWIGVPLLRANALIGIIILGKPLIHRELDWEDVAILNVVGQQIATYLTDAHSERELEQSRQFEEFNRRFAFIVHDIKNVVSQLAMVSVNAETHGQDPKFQTVMMTTLRNSVEKMNALLSRLSGHHDKAELSLILIDLTVLIQEIATARRGQHPIEVEALPTLSAIGDRRDLQIALDHFVQNAIEASPEGAPVYLGLRNDNDVAEISISDTGAGMSGEFIRNQLFKPFSSTKLNGFGIGAGEARDLIERMNGEVSVRSVEGSGSSFLIRLRTSVSNREE